MYELDGEEILKLDAKQPKATGAIGGKESGETKKAESEWIREQVKLMVDARIVDDEIVRRVGKLCKERNLKVRKKSSLVKRYIAPLRPGRTAKMAPGRK